MKELIKFKTEKSNYIINLQQIAQVEHYQMPHLRGHITVTKIAYATSNVPELVLEGQAASTVWNYLVNRDEQ